jgi:hypothetical protein
MSKIKFNPRTLTLILFIVVIGLSRVLIPLIGDLVGLANYSAVGALAIFSAAYFNKTKSFSLPILTLLLSDVVLSMTVYKSYSNGFLYEGWYWVYIAFALMVVVSKVIMSKVNASGFLLATLTTVFIHWIVTDFGIWYGSASYPQTLAGFWIVLNKAIPFEFRFLCGTLGYGLVMFGMFEALTAKFPALNLSAKQSAVSH